MKSTEGTCANYFFDINSKLAVGRMVTDGGGKYPKDGSLSILSFPKGKKLPSWQAPSQNNPDPGKNA